MKNNLRKYQIQLISAKVIARINLDEGAYAQSVRGDFNDDMAKQLTNEERLSCARKWYRSVKGIKTQ